MSGTFEATGRWLPKPTLTGERVTLRPPGAPDAIIIAALLADPELLRFTGSVTSSAEAEAFPTEPDRQTSDWYATRVDQVDRLDLMVVENATGAVIGEVVLNEWEPAAGSANFRTLIGATGRGRGLGTEAARLIIGYGFQHIGLHRIELGVFAFNPRAIRVYEKVGFVREGVRRDAFRFDGSYVDDIIMSILAPEWERHRGRPTLEG